MTAEFDFVSYLVTICPALAILGYWITVLIKDKKELREENRELRDENKAQAEEIKEIVRDNIQVETRILDVLKYHNNGKN